MDLEIIGLPALGNPVWSPPWMFQALSEGSGEPVNDRRERVPSGRVSPACRENLQSHLHRLWTQICVCFRHITLRPALEREQEGSVY